MAAQPKRHVRLPEEDRAPQDETPMVDRNAAAPEGPALNERVRPFLSLVTRLERNWAFSAALILAAIVIASIL
jgi:hypothetical protein